MADSEWDGTSWAGERSDPTITLATYASFLNPWDFTSANYLGNNYPVGGLNQTLPGTRQEEPAETFEGYVRQVYRTNGIVFACMAAHLRLFTQARFQWQRLTGGRPGDLFGTADLGILERPWQNAVTGDLLARAIQDADLAGNFYAARRPGNKIKRMRPDWVSIILGSESDPDVTSLDIDADVLGYVYYPGGKRSQQKPVVLLPEDVAHFAPIPDPTAVFRGMSWLTPIIREIMGDNAASVHKLTFFENGATPNLVIKRADNPDKAAFDLWREMMEQGHAGTANAYRTLYMTAGADATVVGANNQQLDFKVVQGAGETRIAAAAGVPPIIVGLSEGLAAATYSNYGQARRAYADLWARPNWANLAGSLEAIVPPPPGGTARLWYDDRDIPFLAEDQKDAANIQQVKAQTIRSLIDTGYKADAVIKAVEAGDMGLLTGQHTGLFSVQLQAPGSLKMPAGEVPGESPVGPGTKPETIPAGDPTTKPLTTGPQKPTIAPRSVEEIVAVELTRVYQTIAEQRTPVVFESGAFQFNPPNIELHSSPVTIEEGAVQVTTPDIRIDSPITVERTEVTIEPAQVTIAEGAVQVTTPEVRIDSPITVEPAQLTIAEGAIRSETTIEPAQVTIEKGAVQIDSPVTVERTTVEPAQVTIEAPPPAQVTVNMPEQRRVVKDITHDTSGRITKVVETPEAR